MSKSNFYICPVTKKNLIYNHDIYKARKLKYKIIKKNKRHEITDFLNREEKTNFYSQKIFYKNYLSWLSKTLLMSINSIRDEIFQDLKITKKISVLFIGCGFGDEIKYFIKKYGSSHDIYAQDVSKLMILESSKNLTNYKVKFSISNANNLPYKKNFFDLVFHFGGLN
jgi:ubiquinone/menaquinone biosynthesis C-methylase UbiE